MAIFPTRILLATDGSPDATVAARSAIELAAATGSELHVVHVGEFLPTYLAFTEEEPAELRRRARELLDAQKERIEGELGGTVAEAHLLLGRPAEEIINLSERIDAGTVVVGSRGQGSLRRAVLGSVSENVVRYAPCPVFVARAKDG
ncbi:MAG: Universal stress protein family [uncultured Rubrobacteraceae bacterium]|uniref:Universal stress protein family n=1 Tax=uncultured Rubrobacteraceae bacterium TaxID=349277 RepID=A0A6J4RAE3_9ACTN|nr:MAG: Universal stress protein family [uncultured Rubrobacteraceae bacterium]